MEKLCWIFARNRARKSRFCPFDTSQVRLPLAVRHLSSFETCLTGTPFGVFRAAAGHVSQCEKASFVVLIVGARVLNNAFVW